MNSQHRKPPVVLVRPRIYIGDSISIGPGKIDLLREIEKSKSITAAARALEIPYKRAWLLVESLNQGFRKPVVETLTGGKGGGGAILSPLGKQLILAYDALELRLNRESAAELATLNALAK
jgi:molybdate transport system regulatory protein